MKLYKEKIQDYIFFMLHINERSAITYFVFDIHIIDNVQREKYQINCGHVSMHVASNVKLSILEITCA